MQQIKMLAFIANVLSDFRRCFSREAAFKWFVLTVVGLMLRSDHLGVTSIIRDLALQPTCYENLIHFFRSTAYCLKDVRSIWYRNVLRFAPLTKCKERVLLIGDGVKQSKEGRRMPAVKKLVQESETCSKPEYIHGHLFGALGVIAANKFKKFCIPLKVNIQDGLKSAASWPEKEGIVEISEKSHVEQMVNSAFEAAQLIGNAYLILDRYFLTRPALRLLNQLNAAVAGENPAHLMEIITKAKVNCTAFMKPLPRKPGRRGKKPKRGKAIHLYRLFSERQRFHKTYVTLYGKPQNVSYYSIDLLWGQGLYQELRFVLVVLEDGRQSILVSTDMKLKPVRIIELYGKRFSIEDNFREMKQEVAAFAYHFWTKSLEKLNHYARKGQGDRLSAIIESSMRVKVLNTVKATEGFVLFASIAIGIVQMISLDTSLSSGVLKTRFLRTYSSQAPSEGSIMYFLRKRIFLLLQKAPKSFVTQYIYEKQDGLFSCNMSSDVA